MAKCFIDDNTLTSIGNAIRSINGSDELMLPSAMPDAISLLNSGLYVWSKYVPPNKLVLIGEGYHGGFSIIGGISSSGSITGSTSVVLSFLFADFSGYPYYDSDKNYLGILESSDSIIEGYYYMDKNSTVYHLTSIRDNGASYDEWESSSYYASIDTDIFVGFSVSNNENAYPDKAVHTDGFYYEVFDKNGAYVWSKFEISPSTLALTGDGTSGSNSGSAVVVQILNDFVGNSYYDSDYNYVGIFEMPDSADIANVTGYYYISSNSNVYYIETIATDSIAYTYWDTGSYSVSDETKTFLDYVVSDDTNTHPDKATHTDGYWYEKFDSSTLIPENIREGIDIWGVVGTVVEGKPGIDFGEITLESSAETVTVNHGLGVVPSFVALVPKNLESTSSATLININGNTIRRSSSSWYMTGVTNVLTDTSIEFSTYSSSYKYPAKDYYWIAIA